MNRLTYFKSKKKGRMLDIGCSDGKLHGLLFERSDDVFGLDIRTSNNVRKLVISDANKKLPFEDKFFDVIFCGEVIEHIENMDMFLKELHRVLKDDGNILISTPNVNSWVNIIFHSSKSTISHKTLFDEKKLIRRLSIYFEVIEFNVIPYDEISSYGSRFPNLFWVRKCIDPFIPKGLKENMIVYAKKRGDV